MSMATIRPRLPASTSGRIFSSYSAWPRRAISSFGYRRTRRAIAQSSYGGTTIVPRNALNSVQRLDPPHQLLERLAVEVLLAHLGDLAEDHREALLLQGRLGGGDLLGRGVLASGDD